MWLWNIIHISVMEKEESALYIAALIEKLDYDNPGK